MKLSELLFGRKDFMSGEQIIALVTKSEQFDNEREPREGMASKLIFRTSRQQTWLVSSTQRLYCGLDDLHKGTTHVKWAIPRDEIFQDDQFVLELKSRSKTNDTGLVDIGPNHKDWLYSKCLFEYQSIGDAIQQLLTTTMK